MWLSYGVRPTGVLHDQSRIGKGDRLMLRRALILGWLLFGALGPALSGIAADSKQARGEAGAAEGTRSVSPAHQSALADVAELDKPVTYAEEKIALSDLVQKVA